MAGNPTSLLAIHGGEPAVKEGPPIWPRPSTAVQASLAAAYADGSWGRYHGPHVERLKAALGTLCGCEFAWPCSSGTIAVELALRGLKVGPGDEVVLAAYDFPGNFRAIEAIGARPVLVDLTPNTWAIDPEQVEAAISSETKAIIASHLHGALADMPRLKTIAARSGIGLLEDACQAPGALIGGRPAGSWGDCGVLSFGGSKLLTAGRGGAIVTHREEILQRIKIYAERGNDAFPLSELQAAVLLPQLAELEASNTVRKQSVETLLRACGKLPGLAPLPLPSERLLDRPAFYKLGWFVGSDAPGESPTELGGPRERFVAAVQAEGVALDVGFRGFVRRSHQRCHTIGELTHARRAASQTAIMHHPVLLESTETLCRVSQALRKVAEHLADG